MNSLLTLPASRPRLATNGTTIRPIARLPQERDWFDAIVGERLAIVVHSNDVGGRFSIYESVAAPDAGTPMHYHAEDEVFRVLDGVLTFSLDGLIFDAHPGTMVIVPAGSPHAWRNRQSVPAHTLITFMPGGLEGLFPQLHEADPDKIARLAEEYGTHVVGPGIGD